jgi:hypothetical protein
MHQEELRTLLSGLSPWNKTGGPAIDELFMDEYSKKECRALAERWNSVNATVEDKAEVARTVLRAGLQIEEKSKYGRFSWSFCSRSWEQDVHTNHCGVCDECQD